MLDSGKIEELMAAINDDYVNWTLGPKREMTAVKQDMIDDFAADLSYTVGNKYVKITKGGSVWGFIVNTADDQKFKLGDILMAANWKTPARNQSRGNVLDGNYVVKWTGPLYVNQKK